MAGVRIHHVDEAVWGSTVIVPVLRTRADGTAVIKDYHIRLDSEGNCIVSTTVWERLQSAAKNGIPNRFVVVNIVEDPPTITIGGSDPPEVSRVFRQEQEALRELSPKGVTARIVRKA